MMGKFKVGDRVRPIGYEGTHWDGEGTVTEPGGICNIVLINGERGGFFDHELDRAHTTTPPRLGRRYRTCSGVKTGPVQFGMEAEVDCHMRVYDKAGGHVFGKAELDLVEELPLVVRKGGYYRTRDGQKVGPMETVPYYQQWTDSDGRVGVFSADGSGEYSVDGIWLTADDECTRHNLIAEWVDEPQQAQQPAAQPKLKVGDRVRFITDYPQYSAVHSDDVLMIIADKGDGSVEVVYPGGLQQSVSMDDLDLVSPIATKDANTPTPTTGFTVPLCAYDDDTVELTALGRAYLSGWRDAQQAQAA